MLQLLKTPKPSRRPSAALFVAALLFVGLPVQGQTASISGLLLDVDDASPIAFEDVHLLDDKGDFLAVDNTDAEGRYLFPGLQPGSYLVLTATTTHINELWRDVPCGLGQTCDVDAAEVVTIELDRPVTDIDFALDRGNILTGDLFNESTLQIPTGARVRLFDDSGEPLEDLLQSLGTFSRAGLPSGTYYALAYDATEVYAPRLWDGIDCESVESCDPLTGDPIVLENGETVTLSFPLRLQPSPCTADASTLCLRDNRFAVDVLWSTESQFAQIAAALPLPGIDDTGSFWFFDDENVEILVKVLDDCGGSERFWVFAGGLTDVLAQMTVTDTWSGKQQVYFNALGDRYQPVQDTNAFDTCDVVEPTGDELAPADPASELLRAASARTIPGGSSLKQGPCVSGESALCLGAGGRFRVEADWTSMDGSGDARVTPFTDDSGLLWFFDDQNIEVIVKVLDACELFDGYWVFAAGLTDVEVTLTVTDTSTGERRIYENDLGTRFEPVQDVEAFAACP